MKSILYVCAAIALLRSAAALFPNHDQQDPMIIQSGRGTNRSASSANTTKEYLEIQAVAQVSHTSSHEDPLQPQVELHYSTDTGSNADPSSSPEFHIGSSTPQWAITYIPYNSDLTCKTPSTIHTDVATIAAKGFTTIRLYSTDCSALLHIGTLAPSHNLTLIIGVHIDDAALTLAASQIDEIIHWADGHWESVDMIVIGNEAIFNDYTTASTLSSYLIAARAQLRSAGYTGPVTTTEPISILYAHAAELCPAIDILAANIHPFFHAEISAATAGQYVAEQLTLLGGICPGRELEAVNLETGWPRRGRANGEAVPGVEEQRVAVEGILRAGGRSVLLGFGDDGWKDEGEFGVEGSWGCEGLFRTVE